MRLASVFVLLLLSSFAFAQKKTKVRLVRADELSPATYHSQQVQKLSGDVVFKHNNTLMYCDSAYFYEGENTLDAFGHIHINDRDSVQIYADTLRYFGDTRLAELHGNVVLKDKKMTLTTQHLRYNMQTKVAFYYTGGKIINQDNVLTSIFGYYHSTIKTLYFHKDVLLVNPEYKMISDTLIYNTSTEVSYFRGPTNIISKENSIYCERGWYDTKTNQSRYQYHSMLKNKTQTLTADSLFYDRNLSFGRAFKEVELIDTVQNIILKGQYAEYYEKGRGSFVTDSSLAILVSKEKDSLYLHADTLRINFDSSRKAKEFMAYNKVKFFKKDVQGMCDSMVYLFDDSLLVMYQQPLLWGSHSQLSGKIIRARMVNKKMDKVYIDTNAFVMQHDTLEYYNQVSGRNMIAYFHNDSIQKVDVLGNAQSVYFVRDEDSSLVGVNLGSSSDIRIEFSAGGISDIVYINKPLASLNPIDKVSKRALYLRGFKSYYYLQPKTKNEIFIFKAGLHKELEN